jgi:hypothetical protein
VLSSNKLKEKGTHNTFNNQQGMGDAGFQGM